tara:strand:- start:8119 stop:13590 length:5472 start_codon:yes stop_codon:yes gene_type:complete
MASSLNATLNVQLNPQSLNASAKQVQQALGRITGQASEFQKSLDASTARVFAFGATTVVINGVTQSFKKLVATTVDVQKRLVEINSIFQASEQTFNKFRNSIFQVAKDTGQSFATVADGAAELARQGLSAEETASRLKSALILTRISGLDAEKSVKALTAAINGFTSAGLSANQIVNKMVAVDTAFAVSTNDLAEAFTRAGSTAEDAGVSFNQLLGLITAVEQRTARGGAVIGNAFKSIFTRLSRGTTISSLQELGVEIDATQTGVQKLQALSNALQNIADPTVVSKIKELAGGVFQINVVSAALKDIGSQTSIFAKASETAASATNEALTKNKELNKTIAAQINSLVQGVTSLAERVGAITFGPLLENIIGIASKLSNFLDKALDPEKGNVFIKGLFKAIGSFLSGPAVIIFTAAFVKIFKLVAKFAGEGLKALFSMGTQSEKIRSIEGGIVALLQKDENLRNQINASTTSQAQKEQLIIDAIRRENALLMQQAQIVRSLAAGAAARGVTGFGASGFTGGRGRFSMGFRAEEAEARALGAPANVRARLSQGTINGERAIINDKEIEVRNFMGGKDSAIIPTYARGFVPNYAGVGSISAGANRRDTLANIIRGGRAGLKGQFQRGIGDLSVEEANAALKRGRDSRRGPAAAAQQFRNVMVVNPNTGGMLIPTIQAKLKIAPRTKGTYKGKGNKPVHYEYQHGMPVHGPQVPHAVDQAADPEDEQLKKNITKKVTEEARKFAALVHPVLGKPKRSEIESMLKSQGGGKGALKGIIGAAFEAAVNVGLDLSPAKKVEGGDFDVKKLEFEKMDKIRDLFGIKNAKRNLLDFKHDMTDGTVGSFAKKLVNEGKFKVEKRPLKRARKSMGFIPNYASGGGVPQSLMRIHSDDKGRQVLTNIRDEPNGVQDAIKRERKGIGMFASGFVPNYNAGDTGMKGEMRLMALSSAFMALQGALMSVEANYEQSIAVQESDIESKRNLIMASDEEFGAKMRAINSLNKEANQIGKTTPTLVSLAKGATVATNALMAMAALNMVTGGGLGRLGGRALGGVGRGMGRFFGGAARMTGISAGARAVKGMGSRTMAKGKSLFGAEARRAAGRSRAGLPKGGAVEFRQNLIKQGATPAQASHLTRQKLASTATTRGVKSSAGMKAARGLGRFGGVAGVALGGFEIASILRDDSLDRRTKRTKVAGVGGGMAGGLGGMKLGAMGGAAIGSVVPIVGTAVGGIIGGLVGGLAGWFAGKKGAEAIADGIQGSGADPEAAFEAGTHKFISTLGFKRSAQGDRDAATVSNDAFFDRVETVQARMKKEGVPQSELNTMNQEYLAAQKELNEATKAETEQKNKFFGNKKKEEELTQARLEAEEKLEQAARRLAGVRFKEAGEFETVMDRQLDFEDRLGKAKATLIDSETKLSNAISQRTSFELQLAQVSKGKLTTGQLEINKERANIMSGLMVDPRLEHARGATAAKRHNKTFDDLAQLSIAESKLKGELQEAKLRDAQRNKFGGTAEGRAEIAEIQKKLKAAGVSFKNAAHQAGISFKNEMLQLEVAMEENQKKLLEARKTAEKKFIDSVFGKDDIGGASADEEIGQNIKGMNDVLKQITSLEGRVKRGNLDRRTAEMYLKPLREQLRQEYQRTTDSMDRGGYGDVDKIDAIVGISKDMGLQASMTVDTLSRIANTLDKQHTRGRGDIRASAGDAVGRYMRGQSGALAIAQGGNPEEATKDLVKEQEALRGEMVAVTEAWARFNKDEKTRPMARTVQKYKDELDKAGQNLGNLNVFIDKNMNTAEQTSDFIKATNDLLATSTDRINELITIVNDQRQDIKDILDEK